MVAQLAPGDLQWTGTSSSGKIGKEDSGRGAGRGTYFFKERLITQGVEHYLLQHLASCIFP